MNPANPRIHLGLEVSDLAKAVAFYRRLFGVEPTKERPGYAKFEPTDPSVNLSLVENRAFRPRRSSTATHYGIQVTSADDVVRMAEELRAAGLATRVEESTSCCYAVQDKVWVEDPDGNPWEIFVVLADAGELASSSGECCTGVSDAEQTCCS